MLLSLLVLANISVGLFMSFTSQSEQVHTLPAVAAPTSAVRQATGASSEIALQASSADEAATVSRSTPGTAAVEPQHPDMPGAEQQVAAFNLGDSQLAHRECRVWGPEASAEAFAERVSRLRAEGGFPEVKATDIHASTDYLVVVGELGNRDNAKRVSQELNSLDIDNFLITQESGTLAISVGVFSRQILAQRQLQRMLDLGYSAQIDPLNRSQTVYNLTAHVATDNPLYETSISSCMNIAQGG